MVRFDTLCLSITIASLSVLGAWCQSLPIPPPCVRACSDSSAQNASCSSTNVNCICNSNVFANDVASCIVSSCSSTDAAAAVGYFQALCSGVTSSSLSLSGSLSIPGTPSTVRSSTTGSGSGSVTSTASLSGSTSGSSSHSSSLSSGSGLSSSANTTRSTVSSTASGASLSSTSSTTGSSSASASSVTPTATAPINHAMRDRTAVSLAGAEFALALAIALVV